jgi:WD40 repeat protein
LVEVFNNSQLTRLGALTTLPAVSQIHMGVSNDTHLVVISADSTMTVFNVNQTMPKWPGQTQVAQGNYATNKGIIFNATILYITSSTGLTVFDINTNNYRTVTTPNELCNGVINTAEFVFVGCQSGSIWTFRISSGSFIERANQTQRLVRDLKLSTDFQTLYAGHDNGSISIWNNTAGKLFFLGIHILY